MLLKIDGILNQRPDPVFARQPMLLKIDGILNQRPDPVFAVFWTLFSADNTH
jgi:hypothetical protein